ncbi:N-6 DNA methylase [Staphylococcus haemolyticus]|nr:N-6 DNA methylase [Staphylococcus haemolyticus]
MEHKSEFEIVKEVTMKIGLENKTDGSLIRYSNTDFPNIVARKPDGIYEYENLIIVLDAKAEGGKFTNQLEDYIYAEKIMNPMKDIIGIKYNGVETHVYKDYITNKLDDNHLADYKYYLTLFANKTIDQTKIYRLTRNINNNLNDLGLESLIDRMIWTASFLVVLSKNDVKPTLFGYKGEIEHYLNEFLKDDLIQNTKLGILGQEFKNIHVEEKEEIFIKVVDDIRELSQEINSSKWNGEDVMGIFFNEFTRYQKKSNNGQVFTPENWTSFMYKIIDCNYKDRILDAACGSGGFLTKSMSLMIDEMPSETTEIKQNRLYGVEWSRKIFAVACANMLLHKDGKTNIIQGDTTSKEVGEYIKKSKIDKVLMNPPFEKQKGINIVYNVMKNLEPNKLCAFILPDRTLYTKNQTVVKKILNENKLLNIIKMPDNVWAGMAGIKTSIFIFKTGVAHDNSNIVKFWIKDDGLETVKNSGRHDVYGMWQNVLEPAWINIIKRLPYNPNLKVSEDIYNSLASTMQIDRKLEYVVPLPEFSISHDDFDANILQRIEFENKLLNEKILSINKEELIVWILKQQSLK